MVKKVSTKQNIYKVTCEGLYYAHTKDKKEVKPYSLEWFANDSIKKMGFLSAFRNALIQKGSEQSAILKAMLAKYPDYRRFKTHIVTEVVNVTDKNKPVRELALMNRAQIIGFLNETGLPIDPDLYPSVEELRQAVRDFKENREAFEKHQEKRRKVHGAEYAMMRSIEELNTGDHKFALHSSQAAKYKYAEPDPDQNEQNTSIDELGFEDPTDNEPDDPSVNNFSMQIDDFAMEDDIDDILAGV